MCRAMTDKPSGIHPIGSPNYDPAEQHEFLKQYRRAVLAASENPPRTPTPREAYEDGILSD